MKKNFQRANYFLFVSLIPALFLLNSLYAQVDIESAIRETDRPKQAPLEEEFRRRELEPLPETKKEEPAVLKEGQKFFIKKIVLVGCESFPPETFSSFTVKYENQEITLSELNALAKEIEREYLRRGVISAVFIPAQEIKEQSITIRVVEARMGRLRIQEHRYFSAERLYDYWSILPGDVLHYEDISKSVQLMNRNPDREVKSVLRAGEKPGTTDVFLYPETNFPLHFVHSFDKEGAVPTGIERRILGLRYNNLLGFDDTYTGGYSFGKDFSALYHYHSIPVSSFGTTLIYGYSRSESKPKKEFEVFGLKSEAKTASVSLHQALYEKNSYKGEVFASFDAKDKTVKTNTGPINRDRLRVFKLGADLLQRDVQGVTQYSLDLSQGVRAFGANADDNPLASRGAKPEFTKFEGALQHRRRLPLNMQANLKLKNQLSSRKLTPQEEFSLGGIDSVRGYPSGDYLADSAFLTNTELLFPAFFIPGDWRLPYAESSLKDQITALVFFDYGYGKRRGASGTEKKSVDLASVGLGLRFNLFNQALLRLEWGFPFGDRSISESGDSRFHISFDFQDKLPEEIERIKKLIEEMNMEQWAWKLLDEELSRLKSPIRMKLLTHLYLAHEAQKAQDLAELKRQYEEIILIANKLYLQSKEYVKNCLVQEKELRDNNKIAWEYYQVGKFSEAKKLWQEIIDKAKPSELVLEF